MKGKDKSVYWPPNMINLERRPKSLCSILGTRNIWQLIVDGSTQDATACKIAFLEKLGEIHHRTERPIIGDLVQLLKSV